MPARANGDGFEEVFDKLFREAIAILSSGLWFEVEMTIEVNPQPSSINVSSELSGPRTTPARLVPAES